MFNKDSFKINIHVTITVDRTPVARPIAPKRVPVESSVIKSVSYDRLTRTLEIEFVNSRIYAYRHVAQWVYEELLAADSPGQYFNWHIKNCYETREITQ